MNRRGFSLIELLLAATILAIILAILGGFLVSNSRISTQQITAAEANMTVQQSLFRLTEIVSQAHYIYPADQTLSLTADGGRAKMFTTGRDVLALLLPIGNNYCRPTTPTERYCGFVFSIEPRAPYEQVLGDSAGTTGRVLVEWAVDDLAWETDKLPPTSWSGAQVGVLADSVATGVNGSSLGAASNLHLATTQSLFDEDVGFLIQQETATTQAKALIGSVEPRITVHYEARPDIEVSRETYAFSRAIPRGNQPVLP